MSGEDVTLTPITATHGAVLAAVHAEAFDAPWSAQSFTATLAQPGVFGFLAIDAAGEPMGFVLMRAVAPGVDTDGDGEAEVLTIATRLGARRRGVARALLDAALARARDLGADRVHLEVAADNAPAQVLYDRAGFAPVGRRPGYYARGEGRVDAVLMARDF